MRSDWHHIWGCARGPVSRLAPQTRLIVGAAMFSVCIIGPAATMQGSLFIVVAAAVWLLACRPEAKIVFMATILGVALFLPFFLLPFIDVGSNHTFWSKLVVSWSIFIKGLGCMLISIATIASLTLSDLREALVRLPIPRFVSLILVQIVHQTTTLLYETRSIASAMAVRDASGGSALAFKVLFSLPKVWLPRIIARADRVASAMELREYCELQSSHDISIQLRDIMAIVLAMGALGLTIFIRLRSGI